MNESVIIQKLIQVGQMLERGEIEYSVAEIDTKYYLEQYVALHQQSVMVRSEELPCSNCGRPLKEHSKESKLCPDRMKNFEPGN